MPDALTAHDFAAAAAALGCEVAAVKAIAEVESGPHGGLLPTGEPVILYEPHVFHRLTSGKHRGRGAMIDGRMWPLSYPAWKAGAYGPVSIQHAKLAAAARLDRAAALRACSWGRFQIMGFNHRACGFDALQDFVNAMYAGERGQLQAFIGFCVSQRLGPVLAARDWRRFAALYNGSGQIDYYAPRIEAAYKRHGGGKA